MEKSYYLSQKIIPMKFIRLAGACVNTTPLDWKGNLQILLEAIENARSSGIQLLCLPELSIPGYGCEDAFFSGYVIEESISCLHKIAEAADGIIVSVGLPLEVENCLYNVSCLIRNQEILGFVAKQELAGDGVHYEPRWFKRWPNDRTTTYRINGIDYPFGDLIFEIDGIRIGYEICEDAWNGVRPATDHYLRNVDLILNPSASHFAFGKTRIREKLVTETSRAYSCAYLYSNLLGNEAGRIIYDGEILIAQGGNLLARNKRFSFEDFKIIEATIDVEAIRRAKKKSFNFEPSWNGTIILSDEQLPAPDTPLTNPANYADPEFLGKEDEFHQAVTLGLFDYMRKSYSNGFVISLSGGADSSACAVLASESIRRALHLLGPEKFRQKLGYLNIDFDSPLIRQLLACVYQGTANSSNDTLSSASTLATDLDATFMNWDVQPLYDEYTSMVSSHLGRSLNWEQDDIPLQNIQARLRAPGIWMIANINRALLLTTSNRSEAAVGYATMDGDTAGGLAPLGGIDKAFLIHWLKWAQKTLNIEGLAEVNALTPTAELRPQSKDQTDEKDLMPYPILDQIEKAAIRDYKSPLEVFQTLRGIAEDELLKTYIHKFFRLWAINQWKRERYAPSFHLDDANLDPKTWCRFPILSGGYKKELEILKTFQ